MILESDEEEEWAEDGGVAMGNKGGDKVTEKMELSMNESEDRKEEVLNEVIT